MITDDQVGLAAPGDDQAQFSGYPATRNRRVDDRGQAFLGYVVDRVEDAEPAAMRKLVMNEIDRPAGIRPGDRQ